MWFAIQDVYQPESTLAKDHLQDVRWWEYPSKVFGKDSRFVTDALSGLVKEKASAIDAGFQAFAKSTKRYAFRLAFTSMNVPIVTPPRKAAEAINPIIKGLIRQSAGGKPCIVAMDFVGEYGKDNEEPVASIISMNQMTKARPDGAKSSLGKGERLRPGDTLVSPNGAYQAQMQTDGNFVVYRCVDMHPMASSGTHGSKVGHAEMQGDGNFVLYAERGGAVAATDTNRNSDYGNINIQMQSDGKLVIYGDGTALWASDSDRFHRK